MSAREPIAIVGIGCRFPGGVVDASSFWSLLEEGRDAVSQIPSDRMDVEGLYDPSPATPGRMSTRWGGFLEGIRDFDAAFFGISPREAEKMDPQQRLVLECAWEALEDAGIVPASLEGSSTGVYIGQWTSDFEARLFASPDRVDFYSTTGSGRYATSGRLSYTLGLRGPSLTIDTACSSSLAAVHLAVQALRGGECGIAMAAGVNVILQPHVTIAYSQSRMMAADGRCKFGDASGDGYVRSEGAGVIILKPLTEAVADGDRIYAVVRGSAINNDGRSSGSMGTPSRAGQAELLRRAHADAGVRPGRVGYVEAHGTGTRAGDPVELGALADVLSDGRDPGERCWVGSVKTNLGHTEGAAGIAGLIKATLILYHGVVPPSLHYDVPNPAIPWPDIPLVVPRTRTKWNSGGESRIAGVSAFGIAGTNAHVMLEEAPAPAIVPETRNAKRPELLVLSARDPRALAALAERYAEAIDGISADRLRDVCATASLHRGALEARAAFAAESPEDLVQRLRRFAQGDASAADGAGITALQEPHRIAFVFPGQGSQWLGMTRELRADEPVFRTTLEACERAMRPHVEWSLSELLEQDGEDAEWLDDIAVIQPALVAVEIALAALWRSLGVEPVAVVGHSMGEVAAAHVAGALSLDDAMAVVCHRSALMKTTRGRGGMALVEMTLEQATERVAPSGGVLTVAAVNAPRSTVISGEVAALDTLLAELEEEGIFCRRVKVDVASHGPQMDPLVGSLVDMLGGVTAHDTGVTLYSTVTGGPVEGLELGAGYWGRNLREPVRFGPVVSRMLADGIDAFIEVSPHPILLPAVEESARQAESDVLVLASLRRDEPERCALLAGLGRLFVAGHPVDFGRLYQDGFRRVDLPQYPWQRERHWAAEAEVGAAVGRARAVQPDEESLGWVYRLEWQPAPTIRTRPEPLEDAPDSDRVGRKWLVVGADAPFRDAVTGALSEAGASAEVGALDDLEERLRAGAAAVIVVAPESPDAGYLPVRVLQASLRAGGQARFWFVTAGSQAVIADGQGHLSVEQAALWGAARVVAEEHPESWGGLVDVDPAAATGEQAAMLARHLLADDGEDQVAFRRDERFALRLVRVGLDRDVAPFDWRVDGAYLITGGLGDVGLHIARYLADAGVRRLVLLGRTPLPAREQWRAGGHDERVERRIAAIRELEGRGVAVHAEAVDVADEGELRAFVERYEREGWPPVRGVIHAAATLGHRLASGMERPAFDSVVRTKLRGAQLLDQLFPDVDVFILFSSLAAFLPQPGEANYAAANAALDALAGQRHARGRAARTIAWGIWKDTGLVKGDVGERTLVEMARQGIAAMAPERAVALFAALCATTETSVVVSPLDWSSFRAARRGRERPLLSNVLTESDAEDGGDSDLRARIAGAEISERRRLLEAVVLETASQVLKIPQGRLDRKRALGTLGLNSLMAMELRNRLETALGRSLSATLAWNYPTVEAMSTFLAGEGSPAQVAAVPAGMVGGDVADAVQDVAELSDEEALLALRTARGRRGS